MQQKNSIRNIELPWFMFIAGLVLILVGIFALMYPWEAFVKIITYSGFAIVLNGLLILVHALKDEYKLPERIGLIAEGCLDIFAGGVLVLNPLLAAIAFPVIAGYWMIFRGFIKLCIILYVKTNLSARILVAVIGLLSILCGTMILFDPFSMTQSITTIIASFSLLIGVFYCYDAFHFAKRTDILTMMV